MSPKTRNPILAALVAGLSVSLAAPMALAQGQAAQNCILLPDGTRQCNGTGPQGQPPRGAAAQPGQPGQGPGTFTHQGQPPRLGQQGQTPQGPGGFVQQGQQGQPRQGQPSQGQPPMGRAPQGQPQQGQQPQFGQQGQPGQGPGTFAHQGQPPRLGQQGQPPQGPGGFAPQGQGGFAQQGQPGQPRWTPNAQPGQGAGGFVQPGQPGPGPRDFVQVTPGRGMPELGSSARRAPVFQQAEHSRLPPPPAHQHYRVIDGTIVRVDDTTLQVVAIVGLLSAILNSH